MKRYKILYLILGPLLIGIVFLQLFGCAKETEPKIPLHDRELARLTDIRRKAFEYAIECSMTSDPIMLFENVNYEVLNYERDYERINDQIFLHGYYDVINNTIYTTYRSRDDFKLLSHLSLHALGYKTHTKYPFEICGLGMESP